MSLQNSIQTDGYVIIKNLFTSEQLSNIQKEIIAEYSSRAPAKMQEFLLQWQQRDDEFCVNDMLHVRLRASHLKDFQPIEWSPKTRDQATWRNWGVN